jgi:hypothetical protein
MRTSDALSCVPYMHHKDKTIRGYSFCNDDRLESWLKELCHK